MTGRRRTAPGIADPTHLWHEALPGLPGMRSAPCYHRVVGATKIALVIDRCCNPEDACHLHNPDARIRRDELASGVGVDTRVYLRRSGYRAFFFEGPVPAVPIRGPEWLRERRKAEVAAKVDANRCAGTTRSRRDPPDDPPPRPRARPAPRSTAADLGVLGLSSMPTAAELKAAYRKRALATHPDAGGSEAEFVKLRAAYDRLCAVVGGAS